MAGGRHTGDAFSPPATHVLRPVVPHLRLRRARADRAPVGEQRGHRARPPRHAGAGVARGAPLVRRARGPRAVRVARTVGDRARLAPRDARARAVRAGRLRAADLARLPRARRHLGDQPRPAQLGDPRADRRRSAALLHHRRPRPLELAGLALSLAGVVVIVARGQASTLASLAVNASKPSAPRRTMRGRTRSSPRFPTVTPRWSGTANARCRPASAAGSGSLAHSSGTRRWSSSTSRPPTSTPRASRSSPTPSDDCRSGRTDAAHRAPARARRARRSHRSVRGRTHRRPQETLRMGDAARLLTLADSPPDRALATLLAALTVALAVGLMAMAATSSHTPPSVRDPGVDGAVHRGPASSASPGRSCATSNGSHRTMSHYARLGGCARTSTSASSACAGGAPVLSPGRPAHADGRDVDALQNLYLRVSGRPSSRSWSVACPLGSPPHSCLPRPSSSAPAARRRRRRAARSVFVAPAPASRGAARRLAPSSSISSACPSSSRTEASGRAGPHPGCRRRARADRPTRCARRRSRGRTRRHGGRICHDRRARD